MTGQTDPLQPFLDAQGILVLDGGLATELEARGLALDERLWSAKVLLDEPERIREVHLDYLRAGADCVIGASYQATVEGFVACGLDAREAAELLRLSVLVAREARDLFWGDTANRRARLEPLVAASIGPYGAFLADGSEFRGDYTLSEDELMGFHRPRWEILAESGADLLACETLPTRSESRALRGLLEASPGARAWMSFSCRDEAHLCDGSLLSEAVRELEDCPQIVAVGVNCTAPEHIAGLIDAVATVSPKPIVVYPNSGERWDSVAKQWLPAAPESPKLSEVCRRWRARGARLIGGCCRTRPQDIAQLRRCLLS